jgi:hypothetical protein
VRNKERKRRDRKAIPAFSIVNSLAELFRRSGKTNQIVFSGGESLSTKSPRSGFSWI